MKKALGQTVRDIKREVNKKVLKVPSIEQKVLDATSNEPWGPHGSLLADIAQATRNYHEYQMIMSVIWKRINDTGKNWRHVYKALTVLDYLVAHGSERVIDDIREHAYQISTLSDFQYIDSSGRDQGNNVRKKSQSLVVLVNDKERIQEVRQKAAVNREKYRNTSAGSMYRPGSGGYGDRYDDRSEGRYGNRDDDRNGYGRERDDDRYSRDSEERYGRDGYRDDDYRGRSQSTDDYNYGSRSRSADPDRDRSYEDDGQYSSRGSGAKADYHSQDGSTSSKKLERRYSEQNLGAPPSYEEVVGATRSPTNSDRDRESSVSPAPKPSSTAGASPSHATGPAPPPFPASPPAPTSAQATAHGNKDKATDFDEFDPRGSFSATTTVPNGNTPATSGNAEMDLLRSLSDTFSSNALALVPANEPNITPEASAPESFSSGHTFAANQSASVVSNQPFDDPFGDGPFKAVQTTDNVTSQQHVTTQVNSFNTNPSQTVSMPQPAPQNAATEFGDNVYSNSTTQLPPTNPQFMQQEPSTLNQDFDILADILPPSAPSSFPNTQQSGYPNQPQPGIPSLTGHNPQNNLQPPNVQPGGFPTQPTNYHLQSAGPVPHQNSYMALTYPGQGVQPPQMGVHSQNGQNAQPEFPSQMGSSQVGAPSHLLGHSAQPNLPNSYYGQHNFLSQSSAVPVASSQMGPQAPQMQSSITMAPVSVTPSSAIVPQPSNDKFQTKSTVWADTLSRGLVNLNISGSKTNPLNDIGVDFDAINRKEKRMEKPTTAPVTSTITMGKAMGSGSGMGRAGAGAIRPPPNPMMGSGMNMAGGPGPGMNMGGGYGVNQQMGRGMGVGMGMNMQMGMNANMGMNQGGVNNSMQQPTGFPSRPNMPGGYNPMMGSGNYGQQPYGGGYR